tara:strand:+ start:133 stop:519 length:387 start_codon:yes stop_codon:yes gene_type:complete
MFKIIISITSFAILIISLYLAILISIDFFNEKDLFMQPSMDPRNMRPLDFQRNNELFHAELEFEKEMFENKMKSEIERIESKIKLLNESNLEYLLNEFEADKKQLEDNLFFEQKRRDLDIKRLEIERR